MFAVLQKAAAIEEAASSIYRAAARRFASEGHWSELFHRLADEETQHALRVRMLSSRLGRDRQALRDAVLREADLDSLLQEGRDLLKKVESAEQLELRDLLELVGTMEQRFASVHAQTVLSTGNPDFDQFFGQLAAQDRAHAEMLSLRHETSEA